MTRSVTHLSSPRRKPPARGRAGSASGSSALWLDDHRHLWRHARVDLDGDPVGPERLQRILELDLVTVNRDPAASEGVGDVLGGDRAVQLAALADLDAHR